MQGILHISLSQAQIIFQEEFLHSPQHSWCGLWLAEIKGKALISQKYSGQGSRRLESSKQKSSVVSSHYLNKTTTVMITTNAHKTKGA